jgi:ABC-type sugar transport system ATPase subunit
MEIEPYIHLHGITKTFPGVKALDDVSFTVRRGEVHAVVGENGAGKSTLINIIAGNYRPDSGYIEIKGEKARIRDYAEALRMGISVVYQERSLVPNLSVAENVFADRQPKTRFNLIDKKKMREETEKICGEIQLDVRPNAVVGGLIPAKQQMVEIAKALSNRSELLILDEPTATITEKETKVLFDVIRDLRTRGISIIYISHRLQEIFGIADRVTVLKDGKLVGTRDIGEVTINEIVKMMVGRDLFTGRYMPTYKEEIAFGVKNLRSSKFSDISFSLKKGEVLCFAGLAGAGRSEVARAIIGVEPLEGGGIYLNGKRIKVSNPEQAIAHGVGYMPEDRKEQGLFLDMAISHNIVSGNLRTVSKNAIINERRVAQVAEEYKEKLRIVCPDVGMPAKQLSGGNQQKLVFAKWLLVNPSILIVDEPTRGVDVGAKAEIYRIIQELVSKGTSIIVISSDLPEVLTISDRILVMWNGRITAELSRHEANEENIMHYASGLGSLRGADIGIDQ